ncbi:MAG: PadR family transcriptional regulator [Actinobacteria bacterium]|nr:PadR family transcriptional regulator [Actinomycetota bacterium]
MSRSIKLTVPSYVVLGLVDAIGEATPYDMKRLAALSLDHFRSVRHAQLYSEPERLTEAGYLKVRAEQTGRRRKHYSLTPLGTEALKLWLAEPSDPITELRDEGLLKIFFGADPQRVAHEQLDSHIQRLAEFEKLLEQSSQFMTPGQRIALRGGIRNERFWIEMLESMISGELNGDL